VPKAKEIYKMLIRKELKSQHEIFEFLTGKNEDDIKQFKKSLLEFLSNKEQI
jgi:hypothetical protein